MHRNEVRLAHTDIKQEYSQSIEVDAGHKIKVVTFTMNGEYLVSGSEKGVQVWQVKDGKLAMTLKVTHITKIVKDRYDNIQPSIVVQGLLSLLSATAVAGEYMTMSRNSNCPTDPYTPTLDKQYLLNFDQISQVVFFGIQ